MTNSDAIRVALDRAEAAKAISISKRMIDKLIAGAPENGFPIARVGGRVVVPIRELEDWLRDRVEASQ